MIYQWEYTTNKQVINGAFVDLPSGVVIRVHRHIHHAPDVWLVTCHILNIVDHVLESKDLDRALTEAFRVVKSRVKEYVAATKFVVQLPSKGQV